MNVFDTHARIVDDYATYIRSFLNIADPTIRKVVEEALGRGKLWPEALLQFNPSFEMFGSLDTLVTAGTLHPDTRDIFSGYTLYKHQVEAIKLGMADKDFVVTSGTGSGKSLTYIGSIFHWLLSHPGAEGVTASSTFSGLPSNGCSRTSSRRSPRPAPPGTRKRRSTNVLPISATTSPRRSCAGGRSTARPRGSRAAFSGSEATSTGG